MITRRKLLATTLASPFILRAGIGYAQEAATEFSAVLAGARREGALALSLSGPADRPTQEALMAAFKRRFDLDIDIEWTTAHTNQGLMRAQAEFGSGEVSIDVLGLAEVNQTLTMRDLGLVSPYPWADVFAGELPGVVDAENIPLSELRGLALPVFEAAYAPVWNTNFISQDEAPRLLTDMIDPKWDGRLAWNAFALVPLEFIYYANRNPQEALDFAAQALARRPLLESGGSVGVVRSVSAGLAHLGISTWHAGRISQDRGEPVVPGMFADLIPVSPLYINVPDRAAHPNAARLFAAWYSTEGYELQSTLLPYQRARDLNSELGQLVAARVAEGARIVQPESIDDLRGVAEVRERLVAMLNQ